MKIEDLDKQIDDLKKERQKLLAKEKATAIAEINSKIGYLGIKASELSFPEGQGYTKSRAGGRAPIKYRHGNNAWSGRGRKPKWVENFLAQGGALEDLRVNA